MRMLLSRAASVRPARMLLPVVALAFGTFSCGGSTRTDGFGGGGTLDDDAGAAGPGTGGDVPGGGSFGKSDAGPTTDEQAGCSEEAKFVYVVSEQKRLYRFAPDELEFTEVGALSCSAGSGATPNSMAVDRSGVAWVNYSNGKLFKVSTKDASCEATAFKAGQHGFYRFGMAFASNAAGSTDETLFVSGLEDDSPQGKGLATIDLTTLQLSLVGDYDGTLRAMGAELTGTGSGKLYGFFTTSPVATFAEIDKATAATSNRSTLNGVSTGQAWAFSFWGGDFWFYTSPGGVPSSVTRLAASGDGSLTKVMNSVGTVGRIVGAGVSTCAPTKPPK